MALNHLRVAFDSVVPDTHSVIGRAGNDSLTVRSDTNIIDWSLVSNKSEGSHHVLEVPYHDSAIEGARDGLAQIWVEAGGGHSLLVALERALEGRVTYLAINNAAFLSLGISNLLVNLTSSVDVAFH